VPTPSLSAEPVRVRPTAGYGTLSQPWLGWESQIDGDDLPPGPRTFIIPGGFYGVSRPIRLRTGTHIRSEGEADGPAWFLPTTVDGKGPEALFLIDGSHEITLSGLCLNGGEGTARYGIMIRCGTRIIIDNSRFGDFGHPTGAAVLVAGESRDRYVKEMVLQTSCFRHGSTALRLEGNTEDLLVLDNRFEEFSGASVVLDPGDHWNAYGLVFVKNRLRNLAERHQGPLLRIHPGAEGIRLAENVFEGPGVGESSAEALPAAVEVAGVGPLSTRRVECLQNRIVGTPGPGLRGRECGPGFVVAGNHFVACGHSESGSLVLERCHGVLIEDNEIAEIAGAGIDLNHCRELAVNGNEIVGTREAHTPRSGTVGIMARGNDSRRNRITDNRVSGVRQQGILVSAGREVRVTGNEIEDCGEGIRIRTLSRFLLVGNDCRDNSGGGIHVERQVTRGFIALNHSILNGPVDLQVLGERIRCLRNKVDRQGSLPECELA
jgi:parallel beta-helix repeat protein